MHPQIFVCTRVQQSLKVIAKQFFDKLLHKEYSGIFKLKTHVLK